MSSQGFTEQCIMCGNPADSEEHILADWLKNVLEGVQETSNSTLIINGQEPVTSVYSGPHIGHTLRVLCDRCNTKWGSVMQNKCSAVLKPLIKGEWWAMTSPERELIARWLMNFVMVREYAHPELITILQSDRTEFWKTRKIIKSTQFFMAPFAGDEGDLLHWHKGLAGESTADKERRLDTHVTLMTLNNVVFIVVGSNNEFRLSYNSMDRRAVTSRLIHKGFIQVWPSDHDIPDVKPTPIKGKDLVDIMKIAQDTFNDSYNNFYGIMDQFYPELKKRII